MNISEDKIFANFPTIKTDKFLLREIKISDAKHFFEYITNSNVVEFLSSEELPDSYSNAISELSYWKGLFDNKRSIYWGIEKDSKLIGTCGYNNWNRTHKRCEISYDLSYSHWGQGIMTEAVKLIVRFAFNEMGINRVQSTVATDNIASIKVLEKNHFKREGRMEKFGILNGKLKDFFMYSRVR
ncbi:MAG: GNAT family protein [Rickettsiales bacterium]